jgi:hypothetical protein
MALDIKRELAAVDLRNYEFYDKLTPEEKKDFSPYILMRYVANVEGDRDLQEWFLELRVRDAQRRCNRSTIRHGCVHQLCLSRMAEEPQHRHEAMP